ncbi:hypothetical protein [Cytobacillus sp. FSL R5-0596]|uniref:hypothetical protein n=1 Tax=Cytobacillus sp. FSL R5-0596 TaxID=2954696 RepID=UPI0030F7E7D7
MKSMFPFFRKKVQPEEEIKKAELPIKILYNVLKYGDKIGLPVKVHWGAEDNRTYSLEMNNVRYRIWEWADWGLEITIFDKENELVVYRSPDLTVKWNEDSISWSRGNAPLIVNWDVEGQWSEKITQTIINLEKQINEEENRLKHESMRQSEEGERLRRRILNEKKDYFEDLFKQ